jgi:hypothetical protein
MTVEIADVCGYPDCGRNIVVYYLTEADENYVIHITESLIGKALVCIRLFKFHVVVQLLIPLG